jgi:hypothetical protein
MGILKCPTVDIDEPSLSTFQAAKDMRKIDFVPGEAKKQVTFGIGLDSA